MTWTIADDAYPAPERSHDGAVTRLTYPHADETPAHGPDSPVYRVARTRAGIPHATMTVRSCRTDQPGNLPVDRPPSGLVRQPPWCGGSLMIMGSQREVKARSPSGMGSSTPVDRNVVLPHGLSARTADGWGNRRDGHRINSPRMFCPNRRGRVACRRSSWRAAAVVPDTVVVMDCALSSRVRVTVAPFVASASCAWSRYLAMSSLWS